MQVREAMTRDPASCESQATLQQVAAVMVDHDCAAVPITRSDRVVGIVTDRDIVCRAVALGWNTAELPATSVMTTPLVAVGPDDDFDDAVRIMQENHLHHLPVIDAQGLLLGIVAQSDLGRRMSNRELGRLARETSIRSERHEMPPLIRI
jgi:CBS domain-containing protein